MLALGLAARPKLPTMAPEVGRSLTLRPMYSMHLPFCLRLPEPWFWHEPSRTDEGRPFLLLERSALVSSYIRVSGNDVCNIGAKCLHCIAALHHEMGRQARLGNGLSDGDKVRALQFKASDGVARKTVDA